MLAIVEEKKQVPRSEKVDHRGEERKLGLLRYPHDPRDCVDDKLRVGKWCQLDEPNPIAIGSDQFFGNPKRQTRLAAAPGARQCD
jgi:hypothetical protein